MSLCFSGDNYIPQMNSNPPPFTMEWQTPSVSLYIHVVSLYLPGSEGHILLFELLQTDDPSRYFPARARNYIRPFHPPDKIQLAIGSIWKPTLVPLWTPSSLWAYCLYCLCGLHCLYGLFRFIVFKMARPKKRKVDDEGRYPRLSNIKKVSYPWGSCAEGCARCQLPSSCQRGQTFIMARLGKELLEGPLPTHLRGFSGPCHYGSYEPTSLGCAYPTCSFRPHRDRIQEMGVGADSTQGAVFWRRGCCWGLERGGCHRSFGL